MFWWTQMKNLLIISAKYPHKKDTMSSIFVYSQIEILKKYFGRVVVISITPYIPNFLTRWMQPMRKSDASAQDYKYDNVEVYFTKNIVPPIDSLKKRMGTQGYKSAKKILTKIDFHPDIIHAHFTWPSGYIAMRLKNDIKVPYVITGHGYDIYDLPFRDDFYKKKVKDILKNSNKIITVSKKLEKILIDSLGASTDNIKVIPNGYDPGLFYPIDKLKCRKQLDLPINKKIILSVGSLIPEKGYKYLIKAAEQLRNKVHDILFIIVGNGPEREMLYNIIKKRKLSDSFILVGAKPHDEIPFWINACDLFVMSSLIEGVPTVLFEALGCGTPFVGTNVGGIPEIITNNKLGILIPSKNPNALADEINKAIEKDWDNKYIKKYSEKYTWENISIQILQIYGKIS